jgi:hypothetical protein
VRYLLLALSEISRRRYRADLAAPLWLARILGVPPRAALALGLEPALWPLALWRSEPECAAPPWPDPYTAVALVAAVDGCREVRAALRGGLTESEEERHLVTIAASLDGVRLLGPEGEVRWDVMSLDEIRGEAARWLGGRLAELCAPMVSPKLVAETPEYAALAALGALRAAPGGYYAPSPQLLLLACRAAVAHEAEAAARSRDQGG